MLGNFLRLFVLILAPEAYLPLRQLGVNYHASEEGLEAALVRKPARKPREAIFDGEFDARLTALACSPAPSRPMPAASTARAGSPAT